MSGDKISMAEEPKPGRKSGWRWPRRIIAVPLVILALIGSLAFMLDTSMGHRFIADQVAELSPQSGLKIRIGRISGSIYGKTVLHDVELSDPKGVFLVVPQADLDWRPLKGLYQTLDIRSLDILRGRLLKVPELIPSETQQPLLPGFDIRIDRLTARDFVIEKPVAGERRVAQIGGGGTLHARRAMVKLFADLQQGDRLLADIDASPDNDRFDAEIDLNAPRGGAIAALAGLDRSARLRLTGDGSRKAWQGVLRVDSDDTLLAAAKLSMRDGVVRVLGQVYGETYLSEGLLRRAMGSATSIDARGRMEDRLVTGTLDLSSDALVASGQGGFDLADNRFEDFAVNAVARRPDLLGPSPLMPGLRAKLNLDGALTDLGLDYDLAARSLTLGQLVMTEPRITGAGRREGSVFNLPARLTQQRITAGNALADQALTGLVINGTLRLAGSRLTSDRLEARAKGVEADLALNGDLRNAAIGLAGPARIDALPIENMGVVALNGDIVFAIARNVPWTLKGNANGRMVRVDNRTLTSLAGDNIRFTGGFSLGQNLPIAFNNARITASKLALTLNGTRRADGLVEFAGSGRHVQYGAFRIDADIGSSGPNAVLVFDSPLPAAGLKDVRVALSPIADGFGIKTAGQSTLGPFDGDIRLYAREGGQTLLRIDRLLVSNTLARGDLALVTGGVSGNLAISGGGLNGTIRLAPRNNGQFVVLNADARNARFDGATPITLAIGRVDVNAQLNEGRSDIDGTISGQGLSAGRLFVGRFAANARLVNGTGRVTASLAGRRGSRFELQTVADMTPDKVLLLVNGDYAGRAISMPRKALLRRADGGWRIAPSQVNFGSGAIIASGRVGGDLTDLELKLARLPLSLGDIVNADLGLGGAISGIVTYRQAGLGVPTGTARVKVDGLTRSGLLLTSRPVDIAINANLDADSLALRGVLNEGANTSGRIQGRIYRLPASGALSERIRAGLVQGQLRYNGPADALWRLTAIEGFDFTGPVLIAANVGGSVENPDVAGSVSSSDAVMQSALTGMVIRKLAMRGSFAGSRLSIRQFSGQSANGGTVSGQGIIDLSGGGRGVAMDFRVDAQNAQLLNRKDFAATVTGPIRVLSNGQGGYLAGNVTINRGRFTLGNAASAIPLPEVRWREVNRRADELPRTARSTSWQYRIDARAPARIDVTGLGLDSEWGANIQITGTVDAPRISGQADLVRGGYQFAGRRFELERGRIVFRGDSPPNPTLDILAVSDVSDINATVNVGGTALKPEIRFASVPALPEEEVLSRLIFGSSITEISAAEAVQLAAAVASLRGGGGLDPINQLRSAIGLDRLRIMGADAALGRGTSIAAGKYITRRTYVEVITDGKGYSATQIEFQITRWLSLLSSISTIGRQSVNARVSKDY